jgi:tetratricopeptide (TPR) repeat protein/transcriptional regulator with XRE-family HTH domain
VAEAPVSFALLLRRLRVTAGMTQEELAGSAGVSSRSLSELERGAVSTPQKETVRLLAVALQLSGSALVEFEVAARGHVTPRSSSRGPAAATRTLPRDIASFTGRRHELAELAEAAGGAGGVVGICAIGGMAGIGKTALAVHAAHRLAGRFPAGQIFLPLHAHTQGRQPVDPADALASLLLTIGMPAGQIPADLEARTGLWRDWLARRRLLLVLDDAASSEQIRPLLPGAGASLVLVTSRRRLTALEDAQTINLDALPPGEAAGLLVRLAVRPGLSSANPGVGEITRLCGCLPLAIGMAARQLYHHPSWTLAGLAAELAAATGRLELLATENLSVAATFDLSYDDLAPDQQRLFRRLALHPGADIDRYAAAALDGTGLAAARRGLAALYEHYLLTEPAPGRYRMHDLIREHARALGRGLDPGDDREQASGRLLAYYQHAAARAQALLARQTRGVPAQAVGAAPAEVLVLAGREQALAWARAERTSLLACLDQATAAGQHARVIALTAALEGLLRHDGPWDEAITRHVTAVQAARRLGDPAGQAGALTDLGDVREATGDYPGAARDLQEALGICRDLGDRRGQARALAFLGETRRQTGDCPGAARDLQEALGICRDLGDRAGQAYALYILGDVRLWTGDFLGAARDLQEALGICRDLGDRPGQARALSLLGSGEWLIGDHAGAARDLQEALGIARDLGDRLVQANALTTLGAVRRLTGDYPAAVRDLQEAVDISRDLGDLSGQARALAFLGYTLRLTGDYPGAARNLQEALGISLEIGDSPGQVAALAYLGAIRRLTGDYKGAARDLQQALGIAREVGDRLGQAGTLVYLGDVRRLAGEYPSAARDLQEALSIAREIGSRLWQAEALTYLGATLRLTGDYPGAARDLQEALGIAREIGNRDAELTALNESGTLSRNRDDLGQARTRHQQALDLARQIGSAPQEAHALAGLGRCARAASRTADAEARLRNALAIFQRIGAAEAADVSAELDALPGTPRSIRVRR